MRTFDEMQDVFTARLRAAMEKRSMTARDLARALSLGRNTVYHWLSEGMVPNSYTLSQLCDVLGVSADWLLGREDNDE